jgi:hypothetical protein
MRRKSTATLFQLFLMFLIVNQAHAKEVPIWGICEIRLKGATVNNPFIDVNLSAVFKNNGRLLQQEGFYDGNGVYTIRFMPDTQGEWTYITKSNSKELDGISGKFLCVSAQPGVHGPVYVRNTFDFGYADGTPYYTVGTTCYAWVWQGDEMVNKTLETLKNTAFNKIRMAVLPKQYDVYIQNEPLCYPFEGSKEKGWDFSRFNPLYFQYFEDKVSRLAELGVEADVIIFHPYDGGKWGFDKMPREVNERCQTGSISQCMVEHGK